MVLTGNLKDNIRDNTKTRLQTIMTHGALGTDGTTPTTGDTTLGTETFRDTPSLFDTSVADSITATLELLSTERNGDALKEQGWFDDASAGTMWLRNTFNTINKTSDISLFMDTTITIEVIEI